MASTAGSRVLILGLFTLAFRSLRRNRMRSLLTMLGIVIGAASVIVMVAVGRGAQRRVETQISALGKNLLTVLSGTSQAGGVNRGAGSISNLTTADADRLREEATTLAAVSPVARANSQIVAGGANWQTAVYGVTPEYLEIRGFQMAAGEAFTERDVRTRGRVALLGKTVSDNLFGIGNEEEAIGARIRIGAVPFTVVGVLAAKGQTGFGSDQDDTVLAPVSSVLARLSGGRNLNQIVVSYRDGLTSEAAEAEVTDILRRSHRLAESEENDFGIRSQSETAATAAAATQTFTLLLGAIAGVSLIVGGIGIMNILLVAVTERTREIGIRLAIGAQRYHVLSQFLIESVVVSLSGGVIGAVVGLAGAWGLQKVGPFQTQVEPDVVLLALTFSVGVGIFFGLHPARRAAALLPLEALRHV